MVKFKSLVAHLSFHPSDWMFELERDGIFPICHGYYNFKDNKFRSDNPFHIIGHCLQEKRVEHIVVKGRVILAGSLAIRRKCDLQQLRFHRLRVNHNVNAVDCSAVVIMHLRILGCHRDEYIPEHLLYLLVD